ncbi:hypothetical protein CN321_01335 [Bacillus thuringiensis]|uniref:hypothetical protein n=1 Tax=Bacillus thuringiensis TaxID=1428 RepID=UPI000BF358A6|nr:hypothetical protein [Bacillus thuringiensis]PFF00509.1 hypothetical protein CN321_01335 [Bacillus thuringiensis]
MSEINLNVKIGIREWSQPILKVVGESIQRRVGYVLDEKNAIEMINEIAEVIVKHATLVEGPVYINPYKHDIPISPNEWNTGPTKTAGGGSGSTSSNPRTVFTSKA